MFPADGEFSSRGVSATYLRPDNLNGFPRRVDYERGGLALFDTARGVMYQDWRARWDQVTHEVVLSSENGFSRVMFSSLGLTQLALTFSVAMNPYFAYTERGVTWLRWFDSTFSEEKILIPDASQPRLTLDDKRPFNVSRADVVLIYLKGRQLCKRYQRERFLTEHIMANDVDGTRLGRVGMTTGMRVQVELLP